MHYSTLLLKVENKLKFFYISTNKYSVVNIVLLKQVTIVDTLLEIVQSYFFVKHDPYHNAASSVITVIS